MFRERRRGLGDCWGEICGGKFQNQSRGGLFRCRRGSLAFFKFQISKFKFQGRGRGRGKRSNLFKDEIGGGDGAVVAVVFREIAFHDTPVSGVVCEKIKDGLGEVFWIFCEVACVEMLEELEVSFFLSGDEVMDQHRALRGDGFMDGRATGFADYEVVRVEELRNFFRPT